MTFGEKLQTLRTDAALSQEDLAAKLSISRQAISKWELNKTVPDAKYIVELSELFQVTTDYLLKEQASQTPPEPQEKAPSQADSSTVQPEAPSSSSIPNHTALTLLTCGNVLFFDPAPALHCILLLCLPPQRLAAAGRSVSRSRPADGQPRASWPRFTFTGRSAPVLPRLFRQCNAVGFFHCPACGYSEVVDDLLVGQVEGVLSLLLFLTITLGPSLLVWCIGRLIAQLITKQN